MWASGVVTFVADVVLDVTLVGLALLIISGGQFGFRRIFQLIMLGR